MSTQAFETTKTEIVPTSSGQVWYEYMYTLGQDVGSLLFHMSCNQCDTCNKTDTLA